MTFYQFGLCGLMERTRHGFYNLNFGVYLSTLPIKYLSMGGSNILLNPKNVAEVLTQALPCAILAE